MIVGVEGAKFKNQAIMDRIIIVLRNQLKKKIAKKQ